MRLFLPSIAFSLSKVLCGCRVPRSRKKCINFAAMILSLLVKVLIRLKREAKASGITPSFSELDQLIEECLEVEKLEEDNRRKDGRKTNHSFYFHYTGAPKKEGLPRQN